MSVSTFWLEKFKTKLKTLGGFETLQEFNFFNQNLLTDMLKFIYSFILTTLLTNCKAQDANDDFSKNINEMKQYKADLANDDDFDAIENRLIVDISNGIQKVKNQG